MTNLTVQTLERWPAAPQKRSVGISALCSPLWLILVPMWAAVVYFGWPAPGLAMALGNPLIQVPLVFLAAWVMRGQRPNWFLAYAAVYLLLTGLLAEVWGTGEWSGVLMAGQFLFADPSGYVLDATRIVHGQEMISQGGWRPIAHSFLATHLYLFGENLRLIHLVYPVWQAAAIVFALRAICRRVHFIAGFATLGVVLAFLSHFTGVFMTEYVGVMLGCLALGCLVEAATRRTDATMHLFGLAAISLAMLTRAGAFFVLPAILAWACWVARDRWRDRATLALFGFAIFAGAFLFNRTLGEVVADSPESMGNFYYTLYGMATGQNWQSADETGMSFDELRKESIKIIAARPVVVLEALFRAIKGYFGAGQDYGGGTPKGWMLDSVFLGRLLQVAALAAVAAGFIFGRRQPLLLLLSFSLVGFLASLPFAPPWDAGARIYAATVPLSAFAAGAGLALPFLLRRKQEPVPDRLCGAVILPSAYTTAFLIAVFLVPAGLLTILPNPEPLPSRFDDGSVPIVVRHGNYVVLHEKLEGQPYPPHLSKETWLNGSFGFDYFWSNEHDFLEMLPSGVILIQREGVGIFVLPMQALDHLGQAQPYFGFSTNIGLLPVFVEQSFPELVQEIEEYQSSLASDSPVPYLRGFNFAYYPWVSHPQLGFMWVSEAESYTDGVSLYSRDPDYGHMFTAPTLFPKFIRQSDKHELEFLPATGKMVDNTTGEEMELPRDPPAEGQQ